MPRLIARLLQRIERSKQNKTASNIQRKPTLLKHPRRQLVHTKLTPVPNFVATGRTQSILLDSVNPITNKALYALHKSLPPVLGVHTLRKFTGHRNNKKYEKPRIMTPEEREWWASPYLRMLSSPRRTCMLTMRHLPQDFLIRLAPMRLPPSRPGNSFIPDGLEHPKFKRKRCHEGNYIICRKETVELLNGKGPHKRFAPNLSIHALLVQHISHLLRIRVLQELDLLADRLQASSSDPATLIIRRLTRQEWGAIRSTGIVPYPNGVAVLVVPPVNRDPVTKMRIEPCVDNHPNLRELPVSASEETTSISTRTLPPLSTLHPTAIELYTHDGLSPGHLSASRIPLYNGVSLFPERKQRAAFHARLTRLLHIERQQRTSDDASLLISSRNADSAEEIKARRAIDGSKGSHAFLLCSDEHTARRADVAATAIALWRIRMWEGDAWVTGADGGRLTGAWEVAES